MVIWDVATGQELARLTDKVSVRDYTALRFSPDGKFVVAQDAEGTYTIWGHPPKQETDSGKSPATRKDPPSPPAAVPDRFVDDVALVGPAGRIRERLAAWKASGVTDLIVGAGQPEALELLAKEAL